MRILDLYAGTGSATQAFEDAGHEVIKVELDEYFEAHERDVMALTPEYLINKYGEFDFVWASPPCQKWSVASLWKYWAWDEDLKKSVPKHEAVYEAMSQIAHTVALIHGLNPKLGWILENPRGMLRKWEFMDNYERRTVTYCQYGDTRMKPTDLWGVVPNWTPRKMCKNGDKCHESSPAGTNAGGTGKLKSAKLRSMLPYALGEEILKALTNGTK